MPQHYAQALWENTIHKYELLWLTKFYRNVRMPHSQAPMEDHLPRFRPKIFGLALVSALGFAPIAIAQDVPAELDVEIAVYRVDRLTDLPLSRLEQPVDDLGFAGAQLGIDDNQTTGSFLGMNFAAKTFAGSDEEVRAEIDKDYQLGERLIVLNADAAMQMEVADAYPDALIFNVSAEENSLRNEECRANLLHIVPSMAMRADALVQYVMWKKWEKIFLIYGSHEGDLALAESYRHSAEKFRAKIVDEREFTDTDGSRNTDTGYALVQQQIPTFTQGAKAHDVVIAADVNDVFSAYLPYRTWDARPVMGSAGLRPMVWDESIEFWGAMQFQNRFEADYKRHMRETDYLNWVAIRVIGEAVTRTNTADAEALRNYIMSDDFEVAAFKGEALDFRLWNGQLRQPILLSDRYLTVSVSPQDGYLHQYSELDTLGYDQSEARCDKF